MTPLTEQYPLPNNNPAPLASKLSSKRHVIQKVLLVVILIAIMALSYSVVTTYLQNQSDDKMSVASARVAQVSLTSRAFSPDNVKISKGQSVTWVNNDEQVHTITISIPGEASISSTPLNNGESFSYVFSKSGTYNYSDQTNPVKLKGTVVSE